LARDREAAQAFKAASPAPPLVDILPGDPKPERGEISFMVLLRSESMGRLPAEVLPSAPTAAVVDTTPAEIVQDSGWRRLSAFADLGANVIGGADRYDVPGSDRTGGNYTVGLGLFYHDRVGLLCRVQPSDDDDQWYLSEVKALLRVIPHLCLTLGPEKYVSRDVVHLPTSPEGGRPITETLDAFGVGLRGDLVFGKLPLVGFPVLITGTGEILLDAVRTIEAIPGYPDEQEGPFGKVEVSFGVLFLRGK
jgi:hypothetical protein